MSADRPMFQVRTPPTAQFAQVVTSVNRLEAARRHLTSAEPIGAPLRPLPTIRDLREVAPAISFSVQGPVVASPAPPDVSLALHGDFSRVNEVVAGSKSPLSAIARLKAFVQQNKSENNGVFVSPNARQSVSRNTEAPEERITGTLNKLRDYGGWCTAVLWTSDMVDVRLSGEALAALKEGLEYTMIGRTRGEKFEVEVAQPLISSSDKSIERYLMRFFDGIGASRAASYVKKVRGEGGDDALERLREKLLNEPWTLDLTRISKSAKFADGEDPKGQAQMLMIERSLLLRLGAVRGWRQATVRALSVALLQRCRPEIANETAEPKEVFGQAGEVSPADASSLQPTYSKLPDLSAAELAGQAWAMLANNPYAFIHDVDGYSFLLAEQVAKVVGIASDAPIRLAALVEYGVGQACSSTGHTYLLASDFLSAIRKVDGTTPPQVALQHALEQGMVIVEDDRVYTPTLYAAEKEVAERLHNLLLDAEPIGKFSVDAIKTRLSKEALAIDDSFVDGFDEHQVGALASIMTSRQRLHVLTGGPGTGKTAIMQALLHLSPNLQFEFCAPTGMAARVLTSRVSKFGYSASTVHSLLQGDGSTFRVDEDDPLGCDVLVVDETTMNGLTLTRGLLAALPAHAHIIFLGDPGIESSAPAARTGGQLPSISPGRVMQDLLLLPGVNHAHLTKTYRNSGGILDVVKEAAAGKMRAVDRDGVRFSHGLPEACEGFPKVMNEYLQRVAQDGAKNAALIMPRRVGDKLVPDWNTTYANNILRNVCNPHGIKLPGSNFFIGDRVLILNNMKVKQPSALGLTTRGPVMAEAGDKLPALSVAALNKPVAGFDDPSTDHDHFPVDEQEESLVNGDKGTITAFSMSLTDRRLASPAWVQIELDDGRSVQYPGKAISDLDHAYALTVHKVQGSEYKHVLMVVTPGSSSFMNQTMVITGLSRARQTLSVHADDGVVEQVARTPMPLRNSGLLQRVKQLQERYDDVREEVVDPAVDVEARSA